MSSIYNRVIRRALTGVALILISFTLWVSDEPATLEAQAGGIGPIVVDPVSAAFTWSMPSRFGLDANNDDLIDYHDTTSEVQPSSFHVDFDGCASSGPIFSRTWRIDGVVVQSGLGACDGFSYDFSEEGSHEISLTVVGPLGQSSTVTHLVHVQDWLIIGFGDSYGSGEGNPDIPIDVQLFNDTAQAIADFHQAQEDFAQATADLFQAEIDYNLEIERLGPVQQAADAWYLECLSQFPTVSCPGATTNLIVELIALGLQEAEQLLTAGIDAVQGFIDGLVNAAEAALNVAQQAVNTAQTAVTEAETAVDDLVAELQPSWQNRRCHRSALAGQALAARRLENQDSRTSVTFVHLACSGAGVDDGIIGPYIGAEPPSPNSPLIPPQLERALELIGERKIDAVVMSIGGNDLGFGPIVEACMGQEVCHQPPTNIDVGLQGTAQILCLGVGPFGEGCFDFFNNLNPDDAQTLFDDGAAILPGLYGQLGSELAAAFPYLPHGRVFITEYPTPTRDDDGNPCDFNPLDPLAVIPGFSITEGQWAESTLVGGLNTFVENAADAHGWTFVSGMFDASQTHGYCADDRWFVRLQESFPRQGNEKGTVHPNIFGQQMYRDLIHSALRNSLYVNGDLTLPTPPLQPPVAIVGGPYTVNEGSSIQLANSSFDANGDTISYSWDLNLSPTNGATLSSTTAVEPQLSGVDDTTGSVELTASDATGSSTASANVTVENVSPNVQATGGSSAEGAQASVSVTFSDPGTLDTHTATIFWGDGAISNLSSVASPFSANHSYGDDGDYLVEVVVTDDDGGSDSDGATLSISNAPPVVSANSSGGYEGSPTLLYASFTDPGFGDTHSAVISWGDGTSTNLAVVTSPFQPSHVYADEGVYNVSVTVTDDDGDSDQFDLPVTVLNVAPTVNTSGAHILEGGEATVMFGFSDPGVGDTHSAVINWGDGQETSLGTVTSPRSANHVYVESGSYTVTVTVTDNDLGAGNDQATVLVENVPPRVSLATGTSVEGEAAEVIVTFTDAGILDTHSAMINWGDGASDSVNPALSPITANHTYADNGNYTVSVTVTDDDGGAGDADGTQVILNAPPVVQGITGLEDPILLGTTKVASALFSDQGVLDTHTATWDWGDGTSDGGVVTETGGAGMVNGTHTYAATGVYLVTLTITDNDGDFGQSIYQFAVVYNPQGGFVTGAGRIYSPSGAYPGDPQLEGNAHFGFFSKYQQGATVPVGEAQFRFQVADLNFQSSSYQWLVVGGPKAQFKGSGEINGAGDYGFIISAIDGALNGGGGVDKFRIKIWDKATDNLVYDNQMNTADNADPTTAIQAGNIVIHK